MLENHEILIESIFSDPLASPAILIQAVPFNRSARASFQLGVGYRLERIRLEWEWAKPQDQTIFICNYHLPAVSVTNETSS
jgi:hypothetical protein